MSDEILSSKEKVLAGLLVEPEALAEWGNADRDLLKRLLSEGGVLRKALQITYHRTLIDMRQNIGSLNPLDPLMPTKYATKQGALSGAIKFLDDFVALIQEEDKANEARLAA